MYKPCETFLSSLKIKCDLIKRRSVELVGGDRVKMRTFKKSFKSLYLYLMQTPHSAQPPLHSLFFCFRAGQSHASASLLSGWVDVVTGLERQGYTVSLFCHLPPLALTGPNTCIQAPTAQPINHCLLIQYKRKFAQGARLRHYQCLVPIYFSPLLFSRWMSDMKG